MKSVCFVYSLSLSLSLSGATISLTYKIFVTWTSENNKLLINLSRLNDWKRIMFTSSYQRILSVIKLGIEKETFKRPWIWQDLANEVCLAVKQQSNRNLNGCPMINKTLSIVTVMINWNAGFRVWNGCCIINQVIIKGMVLNNIWHVWPHYADHNCEINLHFNLVYYYNLLFMFGHTTCISVKNCTATIILLLRVIVIFTYIIPLL